MIKKGRFSAYQLTSTEGIEVNRWKKIILQPTSFSLNGQDRMIISDIKKKTACKNRNNVTRTAAYLHFFQQHPEIHWALLAHLVSRNGGWSMTDLKGSLLKNLMNNEQRHEFFAFLERANGFIFHDAYPQLLLYERSKEEGINYFHLLPFFGVSRFMKPVWDSFFTNQNSKLLTIALIINEQHYIEKRLIENRKNLKKVLKSRIFSLQERFHLNYVIFPYHENSEIRLIGLNVSHFAPLEERIELGRRLYGMLYSSSKYVDKILHFASSIPHSASREDYFPEVFTSAQSAQVIWSPKLEEAWEDFPHFFNDKDWYNNAKTYELFQNIRPPKRLDITNKYRFTLSCLIQLSRLLVLKNKIRIKGHTIFTTGKGGITLGQNHQFKPGQNAPNNGYYVEIGETGSTVNDPNQIRLEAGEKFPETKNQNRVWMPKRKP